MNINNLSYDEKIKLAKETCNIDILEEFSNNISKIIDISFNNDGDYWIIKSVLTNKNCPLKILEKYHDVKDINMRVLVAEHPNCSLEIIKKMFKNKYINDNDTYFKYIRNQCFSNPNPEIKKYLKKYKILF